MCVRARACLILWPPSPLPTPIRARTHTHLGAYLIFSGLGERLPPPLHQRLPFHDHSGSRVEGNDAARLSALNSFSLNSYSLYTITIARG